MWQNIILIGKGSSLIWFSYLMRLYYYDIVGNCNGWLCHPSHHKWRGHTHWVWGVKIPLTRYWSGIGRRLWRRQSSSWVFSRRDSVCGFSLSRPMEGRQLPSERDANGGIFTKGAIIFIICGVGLCYLRNYEYICSPQKVCGKCNLFINKQLTNQCLD